MKKQNGFSLIEVLIVIAILGIALAIGIPVVTGDKEALKNLTSKTECIGGMQFTKGTYDYPPQQIFDANGYGIECD